MEASPPESVPGSDPLLLYPPWSGSIGSLYDVRVAGADDPPPPPANPIGFIIFKDRD